MRLPRWTRSLKSRIMLSYSLILILGGLSTSMIGIYVTGRALLQQARQQTSYGLSLARTIYSNRVNELHQTVEMLASSRLVQTALVAGHQAGAAKHLTDTRKERRLDFLSVTDATGRVILRTSGEQGNGDVVAGLAALTRALGGESVSGTTLLPLEVLEKEDPVLGRRAALAHGGTGTEAAPRGPGSTRQAGIVLLAASPVKNAEGQVTGLVYAGKLLNNVSSDKPHPLISQINAALFPISGEPRGHRGTAILFQNGVCISCAADSEGHNPIGTYAAQNVHEAVIGRGESWMERAEFGSDRYIMACEPIVSLAGERIGMLAVGLSERPYTAVRDRVTVSFAAIALFCFLLIVVVTYFLTRSLVRPLEDMVSVSKSITAGDLTQRVQVTSDKSELGTLSASFNDMLERISQMKSELENWGKTLEQKVEERSEQLSKVQAQAARQQRLASVGQLAAGVAHEINNPLGGILTFASLVAEDLRPDSPHREDIEEIVRQAVRCRKIVTGLLEFSRKRDTDMASANINQVISRTLALLETQTIFHDIQVARRFDPNMLATIMDESQMQQVFMNLILNAVDAMDGHGTITIETRHSKERKEVLVRITDTGCGIPDEIRESIFDPFFTTKDPGKGTGLGLAVSWNIIQTHRGRLEVESEVGKGTSFTILLPIAEEEASMGEPPTEF